MSKRIDPDLIFKAKPAALPGAHAPAGFVSDEYDEGIVKKEMNHLEYLEQLSLRELESYKLFELRNLLEEAGNYVPYWRNLFREIGFKPNKIRSIDEIQRLPLLDKTMIKENYSDFISEKAELDEITYMTTGGSTGSPLKILMNKESRSKSHAATRYYLKKAGITPGLERGVRLHGNKIPTEYTNRGEFWMEEGNRLTMSVSNISMETCSTYMNAIRSFQPNYIHAYASALFLLTDYAIKRNEKFPSSIRNIFCDSETVYSKQRELIENYTGANFYNIYGHTEAAGMAITFPGSNRLESLPIGIMEIIDPKLLSQSKPEEPGEIVVSGFNNKIMPFIRYRTADIAEIAPDLEINPYKRPFRPILSSVKGRIQDYILGAKGAILPAAPLLFDYNFDWTGIDLFQLMQEEKGKVIFKIVKDRETYLNQDNLRERIIQSFTKIFGEEFKVDVVFCENLPLTDRGKYRYVDQRLEINL